MTSKIHSKFRWPYWQNQLAKWTQGSSRARNLTLLGFSFFIAWLALPKDQNQNPSPTPPSDPANVDTYIPAGYVLVPIDISNFESLDQIFGQFGTVDLYPAPSSDTRGALLPVARAVKLIRSPLNRNYFAVLVEEEEAPRILATGSTFMVVIQNRKKVPGVKIAPTSSPKADLSRLKRPLKKPRIIYEEEPQDD